MASAASSTEFAPSGTYSVRLGSSFTSTGSKDATSYYTFKFNSRLDPTMPSRKARLEKADNDTYSAEWDPLEGNADSTQLNYDATPSQAQEVDCILLFDETTQTFSLQRPSLKFTMRKSRKRKVVKPQLPEPKAPKKLAMPEKRPAGTSKAASAGTSTQQVDQERRSSVDDFTKDLEKDMADILDDIGDDDDDDDDDDNDDMQSVTTAPSGAAPSSDTDMFEEVVVPTAQHQQHHQQQKRPATESPASMNRKRKKYKMASQPILRLDDSPAQVATPPPAATSSSAATAATVSPPIPRREFGGKSISSAAALAASRSKKAAAAAAASAQSVSESSSGSSSSGESGSSSSGESGSSSSGSEDESSGSESDDSSDDDDMDDLLADIDRDLLADSNSVPPSPNTAAAAANARSHNTPVVPEQSPYSASPSTARGTPNRNGGPVSLRALFNDADHGEEDEGITSSDSESDGD